MLHSERSKERQRSEEKGRGAETREQPRWADVAMLLFQASALLPGYSLSHTCPESLELQVSSGVFLKENFILVDRVVIKKKGGCP